MGQDNAESPSALNELKAEELEDWKQQMEPIVDPIAQLAKELERLDEFLARLPELFDQMDTTELVKQLALQTFKARGLGDATDEVTL